MHSLIPYKRPKVLTVTYICNLYYYNCHHSSIATSCFSIFCWGRSSTNFIFLRCTWPIQKTTSLHAKTYKQESWKFGQICNCTTAKMRALRSSGRSGDKFSFLWTCFLVSYRQDFTIKSTLLPSQWLAPSNNNSVVTVTSISQFLAAYLTWTAPIAS